MNEKNTFLNTVMTGRQRMRTAMSRQRADRVPTMPQICHSHAVHVLCKDFRRGIADIIKYPRHQYDLMLEIARHYGVDGLRLFVLQKPLQVHDDGEQMIATDPQTGRRVGVVDTLGGGKVVPDQPDIVIENADDVSKIGRSRCEDLLETDPFGHLAEATAEAHKHGLFVASSPPGFTVNFLSACRGRQQALMDLMESPELAHRTMDAAVAVAIEHARALVQCGVDALYIGDPSSSASLISPRHFEEFCLPRFRLFCDELHKLDVLIYIHICGNSNPILEMMADTGTDCVEPLDPLGGVDAADAARRIGHRVALMGGVNTLTMLQGSPQQVYDESVACCRAAGVNGGYILAAGDMVPDMAPEENVRAMVRAAKDFSY